jgi:hypothetical protein
VITLWNVFRMFVAKGVADVAESTVHVVPMSCTRGLTALARALVPEEYRKRDRGQDVRWF